MSGASDQLLERVRGSELLKSGQRVVAMLSGGQDSVCLLDVAVRICGRDIVTALHVNYGLREAADEDERHCAALCAWLGVGLEVVHANGGGQSARKGADGDAAGNGAGEDAARGGAEPSAARGNLQAWARDLRYEAAARIAERLDATIAVGHTASDQVETILYRLAASPGRRALLGMSAHEGRVVRPLLGLTREQTAEYCRARGITWREDESNLSERYARNRVRHSLIPALRAVHPTAEANVLRTAELLREETRLFDGLVEQELAGGQSIEIERLATLPRALARLVVVRLAEQASQRLVPQAGERVEEIVELGRRGGSAELHVGGLAGAVIEQGRLSMVKLPPRLDQRR